MKSVATEGFHAAWVKREQMVGEDKNVAGLTPQFTSSSTSFGNSRTAMFTLDHLNSAR